MKLGATGKFPQGKLSPSDEGELVFKIGHDPQGNVYLDFGKPVTWFALPAEQAFALARRLWEHAMEARREELDGNRAP